MYYKASGLLLLVLLLSCNETVNTNAGTEVSISEIDMSIERFFNEIKDDISFIQLETNDDCLLGQTSSIIMHDNYVFIIDQHTKKRVLMFDNQGRFIRSFGKIGKGPDEHLELFDFQIIDDQLVLLVGKGKPFLYYYDIDKLAPVYSTTLPNNLFAYSFKSLTKDRYLFYTGGASKVENKRYELVIANMRDKTVEGILEYKTEMPPATVRSIYENFKDGGCYYSDINRGTISSVNTEGQISGYLSVIECKEQRGIKSVGDFMSYRQSGSGLILISKMANSINDMYFQSVIQLMGQVKYRHVFCKLDNNKYKVYDDTSTPGSSINAPFFYSEFFYCLVTPKFAMKLFPNEPFKIEDNPILLKIPIKCL